MCFRRVGAVLPRSRPADRRLPVAESRGLVTVTGLRGSCLPRRRQRARDDQWTSDESGMDKE